MMKNFTKLFGIISLAALIGFLTAACGDGDSSGGDSGDPAFLGDTLVLSGQVYLEKLTETGISYQKYNGNLTIEDYYYGGSGEVKNGKLSYSIETPTNLETLTLRAFPIDSLNEEEYDNLTISNENVTGVILSRLSTNNNTYSSLVKESHTLRISNNGYSQTIERVYYVYVHKDVTISGKGKTRTGNYINNGTKASWSVTNKNFSLALRTGWNAVYIKDTDSFTLTGPMDNPTSSSSISTNTISLSNPSLRWVCPWNEP